MTLHQPHQPAPLRRLPLAAATAMGLALALAGCGGSDGSTGIASVLPVPSTPSAVVQTGQQTTIGLALPPTPALVSTAYDTLGILSAPDTNGTGPVRKLGPAELGVTVDASTKTYTLTFDLAAFPGLAVAGEPAGQLINTIADPRYGHAYTVVTSYSDGTTTREQLLGTEGFASKRIDGRDADYASNTGLSYVSLGQWQLSASGAVRQELDFVYGQRTAPAALPVTGTAYYSATHVMGALTQDVPPASGAGYLLANISLTADFGDRSIGAVVATAEVPGAWDYGSKVSQNLSGSSQISMQGAFDMGLEGTLTVHGSTTTSPVTGTLGGAFFGPSAEQVGGYLSLPGIPSVNSPINTVFAADQVDPSGN